MVTDARIFGLTHSCCGRGRTPGVVKLRGKKYQYLYVLHSILYPDPKVFRHYYSYVQHYALPSIEKIRRPRV